MGCDFFIQPKRHLFQPENSTEAVKSGTMHSSMLHVLWCNVSVTKPCMDWFPQTTQSPCLFAITDGSLWRYCPHPVRVCACPSFWHFLGVRIPTAGPRTQKGCKKLVLRPWGSIYLLVLQILAAPSFLAWLTRWFLHKRQTNSKWPRFLIHRSSQHVRDSRSITDKWRPGASIGGNWD